VRARISAAETVARLETEYRAARARLTSMA